VFGRELQKPTVKPIDPPVAQVRWNGERNKAEERLAAHGCQIGQAACQSFMADVDGSVGTELEVPPFENEICCEDEIVLRFGAENGTVVADASN
jgi:hypothetical protein